MFYKVLITASGVGQKLGDLTKYTNQALVRIGQKPVISHIIEAYPAHVPFVITTGYFGDHVKEFVRMAYPERKVEFVDVKNYQGPGSSLGYSMLQAKNSLQCPFIFHACDTITTNNIPTPRKNWIGGYRGHDASQYSSWKVLGDNHYVLNEKGALSFDYIHIGLMGIKDYRAFWHHLEEHRRSNAKDTSLNDCQIIAKMLESDHVFDLVDFTSWYDTGNTKALEDTRQKLDGQFKNLHKIDEAIFIVKNKVIKFFHDAQIAHDRVKRQKLLKGLVPNPLGHEKNFYAYRYTIGELYSRVVTPSDFRHFLEWARTKLWISKKVMSGAKFKDVCYDFYHNKTQKRIAQFLNANHLKDESHIINGETVPTIAEMLKQIDFDAIAQAEQYQFHGDFILDNVIKTKTGYRLIDWRQHFGGVHEAGDLYYDIAKLNHNLTINHDIVHQNLITIKNEGGKIHADIHRTENLVECQRELFTFIKKHGYDLKKVELLTAIIWLNMSPLHEHPFGQFLYYFGKLNLWRAIKKYHNVKTAL